MNGRDRFGPSLRRIRQQRGIPLQEIADRTNVDVELWDAMERNDFSRWPSGISARAFVREYARVIGVDPESAVDDFCRAFPQGDRRRGNIIRAGAELLGGGSQWQDDLADPATDRRRAAEEGRAPTPMDVARNAVLTRRSRIAAVTLDVVLTASGSLLLSRLTHANGWAVLGIAALGYHAAGLVSIGATPGSAIVSLWLRHSPSEELRALSATAFPRLRRSVRAARS
jgi:transcriptional regulator with XRE-family HTH domain